MIRVTVEFVGPVRRPTALRRLTLELDEPPEVSALLARLGYTPVERPRLTVLVDGTSPGTGATIPDGARVEILLPVGGGR